MYAAVLVAEEYLTIKQAAERAGYRNPGTLHQAARTGALRTIAQGPLGTRVTTPEWLQEYLDSLSNEGFQRGRPRILDN